MSASNDGSSRRSACDRCRAHKLRCERDAQQELCRRCLKARARCITGHALPTGRPPLPRPQQTPQHQDQQPQPTPPYEPDYFPATWTPAMQPQPAPSPLPVFDASFLDGDFDFQAFLPEQLPVDTSMHDAHHSPPVPSDRRQECLQKLGNLHAALLADVTTVRASKVATEATITSLHQGAAAHETCGCCNVPVGRMLTAASQLLDILHYFSPAATPQQSSTSTTTSPEDTSNDLPLCPDIPTTLSILACYAALRRIYRTIFACIDASLRNFAPIALPALFPGLTLGGFQLGGNVALQVLIVAQLSETILAKIDAALGVGTDGNGLVGKQPAVAGILKAVVREEEAEGPGEGIPGGCRPLGKIIESVKRLY